MRTQYFTLTLLVLSLAGNVVQRILHPPDTTRAPESSAQQEDTTTYLYLSKRIFAEDQNDILINFTSLRADLRSYIATSKAPIGLYFEYLPSGSSIGVNEKKDHKFASLLKVPIVMVVYDLLNAGSITYETKLTIQPEDLNKIAGKLWERGAGATITVNEAIHATIIDSDNTSKNVLLRLIKKEGIQRVFDALDIPLIEEEADVSINPKTYSSVMRSLYLASYLPKKESNDILTLLSNTNFPNGIVQGIPKEVTVAHKFGIVNPTAGQKAIYRDCGIVYVPKRPYILCMIITDGQERDAWNHMTILSRKVYDFVSQVNTK